METNAKIAEDGRINININQRSTTLYSLLAPAMKGQLALAEEAKDRARHGKPIDLPVPGFDIPEFAKNVPPLNILIQIIGSRGDVQPFIALGQVLKNEYKHRVRVATHPTFKEFVEENGLEFFSLSGDPSELMAFMVKNPGLMPGFDSLRNGDVTKRRKAMWDVLVGGWRACIEPGDGTSYSIDPASSRAKPFVTDAIIANPPSFGHIHCAEKLGVPLHLMFTMPWSPTTAFPHPLANIQSSNAEGAVTNFLSYILVEMMTWQGLGDLVNKFRERRLGLDPISTMWAPGMVARLKVPHTYCWSPSLIPKPLDWPQHISISGFYFLSLASSYTPPPDLANFLATGSPPVYIGFGSIVVDDPNALTDMIFAAVRKTGVRALVSKGWGGLGGDQLDVPPGVMMLGNCPHDWLFPRCSAVIHHGGAGTTAAGIRCGKPSVIVPFFGDQPFWGSMVAKAGAGPEPTPFKKLTADILAESISMAISPQTQERAEELGARIRDEKGAEIGAKSFLSLLGGQPGEGGIYRCMVDNTKIAAWRVKATDVLLSSYAASILVKNGKIEGGWNGLKLCRHKNWDTDVAPPEPISGAAGALIGTLGGMMMEVGDFPKGVFKQFRKAKPENGSDLEAVSSPPDSLYSGNEKAGRSDISFAASSTTTTESGKGSGKKLTSSKPGEDENELMDLDVAIGASKSVGRIVEVGLRSPMDFSLSLAQGFHNAPKLYGDNTVRPLEKVTGFHSGLKAAGKGLGLGLYDGVSGIFTQPIQGAREEGAAGFLKGFGKGIGGVVLKGGAAMWAVPGYTMKGIHREIQKLQVSDVDKFIIGSRIAIAEVEFQQSSPQLQQQIIGRWHQLGLDKFKRVKHKGSSSTNFLSRSRKSKGKGRESPEDEAAPQSIATHIGITEIQEGSISMHRAVGNSSGESGEEAYQSVIRASAAEAERNNSPNFPDDPMLEEALRNSLIEGGSGHNTQVDTQDEELERALRESIRDEKTPVREYSDAQGGISDPELQRAIEESRRLEIERESKRKTEDEVIIERVKQASLEEQEYERRNKWRNWVDDEAEPSTR
ncbi:UDP-Glycosyltransferase/glycogen phosphorylase [Choiromyces venosus 120613-1]|uniref:UDP-Glycosyltransferase/glycogen phosphorylase n=1 Tax=Choiromyces venosus 120613-1 TaxID=1336337 RepID=A0A3N4JDQ8_9PEZI|nr:UDP-Glycosyltransferase/glycogen phosphorylase [Choiromyces venosus 120613-1]